MSAEPLFLSGPRFPVLKRLALFLLQVVVDVPRTAPGVAFFHRAQIQKSLERILYIWGVRWAVKP